MMDKPEIDIWTKELEKEKDDSANKEHKYQTTLSDISQFKIC
jgi:hypothetical protein